jgi:ABC-type nitrate/sulfonate/bicarbonate transport system ATPase subunit
MFMVTVQTCDPSAHGLVVEMLEKTFADNTNIAIFGQVGIGKTTLLRKLVDLLKTNGLKVVRYDFDEVVENCQGKPDYIVVDHPSSLQSLKKIREEYPGVPLLAILYERPEEGFDVLVQVWHPTWGNTVAS